MTDDDSPWPQTILEAGTRLRNGSLTSADLARHFLDGIASFQPKLNAFITVTGDMALETAAARDADLKAGRDRGPLHGIPIVIKDDTDVAGYPATVGSAIYRNRMPDEDATVVKRLKDAGAVILGKTNMNEFAAGGRGGFNPHYGDARNPWSLEHEPGGSSSGTGGAVAARLCLGGTGTDAGGSVRGPAARCGIVGIRPTFGRVSKIGIYPRCWSFEAIGPLARTVSDAALMLDAMAGYDPADPISLDAPTEDYTRDLGKGVEGLRLGVIDGFSLEDLDPPILAAMKAAIGTFTALGAEVRNLDIPVFSAVLDAPALADIIFYEFNQALGPDYRKADKSLFGEIVHADMAKGAKIAKDSYEQAIAEKEERSKRISDVFDAVDAFLTPTFPRMHMALSDPPDLSGNHRRFNIPMSYFGLPSVSQNCGFDDRGLPIGLQIVGNRLQESTVLRIAAAFEGATDFHTRRPPLCFQ
jgi:aspartyl-tRNA(Asn)/glutamyl-tRNA(Gln) amidotransferase subunit A